MECGILSFHCRGSKKARTCLGRPVAPNCDLLPGPPPLPTHRSPSSGILMVPKSAADSPGLESLVALALQTGGVGWGGVRKRH